LIIPNGGQTDRQTDGRTERHLSIARATLIHDTARVKRIFVGCWSLHARWHNNIYNDVV